MRKQTERKYRRNFEVKKKISDQKLKETQRSNRLMADLFNKVSYFLLILYSVNKFMSFIYEKPLIISFWISTFLFTILFTTLFNVLIYTTKFGHLTCNHNNLMILISLCICWCRSSDIGF